MTLARTQWRAFWRWMAPLLVLLGLLAPAWSRGDVVAQSSLPVTAEAAPANTVIFHTLDLDPDGAQWQQAEALLARVGLPGPLDLWETAILEEGAATGDFTAADLDALLGGEMAIAVLPIAVEQFAARHMAKMAHGHDDAGTDAAATPMAGEPYGGHGVVGILDPGDLAASWDYVRRQLTDLAAQRDVSVEESTYEEADLLWVPPADHAPGADMDHGGMDGWNGYGMHGHAGIAAARAGEFIVAGKREIDVTTMVDVIAGNADDLAGTAELQAVAAELPAEALSLTYVNGQGILDALGPDLTAQLQVSMPEAPIEAYGGQSGFVITADEPGFRFDAITVSGPGADPSAMVPENDPAVAAAAERAPAGTFIFQAGRLAETAFASAPYSLAQAVNAGTTRGPNDGDAMMPLPTAEEMAQEIATAAATLGFDPGPDLFDLLGDEFIAFATFPSFDFENFGVDAVAAISTSDADALAETARKTAAWIERSEPNTDVSVRQAGGDTVYVVTSDDMPGAPGLEFGVVADQAVVAVGGGINALLADPAESLANDPQYQTVMGLLPGEYYQVGYVDIGQAIQPLVMLLGMIEELGGSDSAATLAPAGGPENIRALGAVAFQREAISGASAILYIANGG